MSFDHPEEVPEDKESYEKWEATMTTPDLQQVLLAEVDAEIKRVEIWLDEEESWTSQEAIDDANRHLGFLRALRAVLERCAVNGYTTWDKNMVPLVDGKYDPAEANKWELAHGHDIRLKCYAEFGCQLLIDPEDLLRAIGKEMGK